jgi:CcmD family protein
MRSRRLLRSLGLVAAALAAPAAALAQEFQQVDRPGGEQVPAVPFVGIAYGFIWIALLVYVVFLARGLARVRGEIGELRRKIGGAGGGTGGGRPPERP